MNDDIKQHIKERKTWLRGLYMLVYIVCYSIAEIVFGFVVLFQFVLTLLTGKTNERLLKLGQGISTYVYQIFQFLSFNDDYHPYPFGAWPSGPPKVADKSQLAQDEQS